MDRIIMALYAFVPVGLFLLLLTDSTAKNKITCPVELYGCHEIAGLACRLPNTVPRGAVSQNPPIIECCKMQAVCS